MKVLKSAPKHVISNVLDYFKRELPKYTVVSVIRKHAETAPDNDNNLYFVIAKGHNPFSAGQYSCWTCWNDSTRSLNSGHYWLTLSECFELALEQCDDSIDVVGKTGTFVKSDKDLLELSKHLDCSFVISRVTLNNSSTNYTIEESELLVLAFTNMEE